MSMTIPLADDRMPSSPESHPSRRLRKRTYRQFTINDTESSEDQSPPLPARKLRRINTTRSTPNALPEGVADQSEHTSTKHSTPAPSDSGIDIWSMPDSPTSPRRDSGISVASRRRLKPTPVITQAEKSRPAPSSIIDKLDLPPHIREVLLASNPAINQSSNSDKTILRPNTLTRHNKGLGYYQLRLRRADTRPAHAHSISAKPSLQTAIGVEEYEIVDLKNALNEDMSRGEKRAALWEALEEFGGWAKQRGWSSWGRRGNDCDMEAHDGMMSEAGD